MSTRNERSMNKLEITNEMVRLYKEDNLTMEEIGEKFGVSKQRVQQRFKEAGVNYETKALNRFSKEALTELHVNQKLGTKEIAEKLGCNHTTVSKYLDMYGIREKYPQKNKELTKEVLQKLYVEEGKSQTEIAKQYGYVQSAVSNLLQKHGIPRRADWTRRAKKEAVSL